METTSSPTPHSIIAEFIVLVERANEMGRTGYEVLATSLSEKYVTWMNDIYDVSIANDLVQFVRLMDAETHSVLDVVIKLNISSNRHYLQWINNERKWCLVEFDDSNFVFISSNSFEIAKKVVGGIADGAHRQQVSGDANEALLELPMVSSEMCFLCNENQGTTKEHVFPRWLLHRFGLINERLTLLNGTQIRYQQLTVSACERCNNNELSQLETTIKNALESGYDDFNTLNKDVVFQWVGKIFLALLVKEALLPANRRDFNGTRIVPPEIISNIRVLRQWLQVIYRPIEFDNPKPWSIFVMPLLADESHYFYQDNVTELTFSFQLGKIGIILVAQDHLATPTERRINSSYGKLIRGIGDTPVHPLQFVELFSRISYSRHLCTISPAYRFEMPFDADGPTHVSSVPVPYGVNPWQEEEFSSYFQAGAKGLGYELHSPVGTVIFDEKSNWVIRDSSLNEIEVLEVPRD